MKRIANYFNRQRIADLKEARERLIRNEHKFRSLIEQSAEGIAILSAAGNPLYISPSIKKILGYSVEEIMEIGLFTISHPDDIPELEIIMKTVLENPGIPVKGHTGRMRHKDGSWRWLEATVTNMLHDPAIEGIVDNFRDITEKKQEEKKLVHANRLYAFISQLNQSIVHSTDEQTVFKKACSIAIEFGKFKAVWIGMIDIEKKQINVVEESGLLQEDIKLFTNAPYDSKGPQAYVINNATYHVINNVQAELELNNWKLFALERGYNSCLALPIRKKGEIIATLNIYAAEINFFKSEEIALLQEAAGDISFSLDLFEDAELKKRADQNFKASENSLRESETFNKGILASLSSHIAVIEKNGNIIAVNKAWNDFAKENGITHLERVSEGSNYFDVCARAAAAGDLIAEQALDGIQSVFKKKKETFELEYPCNSPDEQRWFVLRVMNFGSDGAKVVLAHQNISARKKAEESLHRSQSNLKAVIDNTDATIYSLDSKLRYITFNQQLQNSLLHIYGLSISPGDKVYDFLEKLEPGEARAWETIYHRALQGETIKFEKEFHIADHHSYYDFAIYPIWENKNVIGLSCFAFDVTGQKQAKEFLRQSEQRYRQIVETAQEGIWLVNEHHTTIFVNDKLCRILGYEKEEMIGKHIYSFMDEKGRQITEKLAGNKRKGENSYGDFKYISKTGKEIWTNVAANPMFDDHGKYAGALAMISDITEKKKLEVLLDKANSLARLGNWEADLVANTLYWSAVTKRIYEVPHTFIPDPETTSNYYKEGYSRESIKRAVTEALDKNIGWDLELQIVTAKGNTCWVRTIGEAECADGKCIRLSGSIQDIDAMKKTQEELKDKNKELKELSAYLQNVRETERKHIAREVHDELGQLASSLQIDVDWLGIKTEGMGENVNGRIIHANKTIKELITTIRKIASGLRPGILDDFGLNAALQWYCNEFQQLNNIECEYIETFNDTNLTTELKTELFRMSQESLTNVMRHAKAKKATVAITEDDARIYLAVTDDGVGFDTCRRKNTLGLLGLKERAVSVNGELNIVSSPGKGTTISAIITKQ